MFVFAFSCLVLFQGVLSYSSGAPAEACQLMTPSHNGATPQPEPSPYWAEVVKRTETNQFDLTIHAGDPRYLIGAIMIQARDRSTGELLGTFTAVEDEIRVIDCLGGTQNCATHAVVWRGRTNVTVTWTAPEGNPLTNINFVYTVLGGFAVFWINQIEPLAVAPETFHATRN